MDFFEQQHLARRNTRVMVILFLLAVIAVVTTVDLVAASVWLANYGPRGLHGAAQPLLNHYARVPGALFFWVSLATAGVILIVSTVNVGRLAGGGAAVAEMVGARRIEPGTREPLERRLVNIVEEMAIAAGTRVPAVYVMDAEPGINAFAAGWDSSSSVITVTRGTLEMLSRDELQGVIGHEFSHIVNGDMRLNVRMIGVLAGILFIGSIGQFLMRSLRRSDNKGAGQVFVVGLALFIIGYVGLFFARLIKAAVSRQREFLADASSVQFTRNPDGIAGALDQIRTASGGALISGRYAEEISHMFFGQAIRVWLGSLFDTHPPLDERIRRVNPGFRPSVYRGHRVTTVEAVAPAAASPEATEVGAAGRRAADLGIAWGHSPEQSASLVGALNPQKLGYAEQLLSRIPAELRESLREADGAAAAIVALLLAPKDEVMQEQLQAMKAAGLAALAERAAAAAPKIRSLGLAFHLALVDLSLLPLKAAPEEKKKELIAGLEAVINADRRVSLHEFIVLTFVREQLWRKPMPPRADKRIADLKPQAGTLLALMAYAGTRSDVTGARADALQAALRAGAEMMSIEVPTTTDFTPGVLAAALEALKSLRPLEKALLVKGLFATVTADGTIRVVEAGIMRLVGAVLDCPLPPLLDEMDPAALAA
ncbi:MAG TPA: M48 family metallopeptidase [Burkholderiales bacterium]|nr:M48 family metallopeptidase [Burkholderiales bacterium]